MKKATIIVEDEVNCIVHGLTPHHTTHFWESYGVLTENHFFHPKVKLGVWDGKIRYFSQQGKTYVYLLDEIIPTLVSLEYDIDIIDQRKSKHIDVKQIDEDIFSHVIFDDTGDSLKLRPHQLRVANALIENAGGIGIAATGAGKAQPVTSNVLTANGWTQIGNIVPGDILIDPANGHEVVVKSIHPQGIIPAYLIIFDDGTSVEACGDHLWKVKSHSDDEYVLKNTNELIKLIQTNVDLSIPLTAPIDNIGSFGMGYSRAHSIGVNLAQAVDMEWQQAAESLVFDNINLRLHCLRGIYDTLDLQFTSDGFIAHFKNDVAAKIYVDLTRSVGLFGKQIDATVAVTRSGDDEQLVINPFYYFNYIHRNAELSKRILNITPIGDVDSTCIKVNNDSELYITDGYTVTHNTFICAAVAKTYGAAGCRTIVIVPSQDLVSQTREEFIFVGLDCGEYSGDVKDYQTQSCVISTWQALNNNPHVVKDFNVVIVDEAHNIRGKVLTELLNVYGKDISVRYGVTGTMPKGKTDEMAMKIAVGTIQEEVSAKELMDLGILASLHIHIEQLDENLTSAYKEYVAEHKALKLPDTELLTYKRFKSSYFPDWTSEKQHLQKHKPRIQYLADRLTTIRKTGNTFVLIDGVAFGKKLAEAVGDGCVFVHGKDKKKARKQIYNMFNTEDNLCVIATVNIASTGLNIKRIYNLPIIDAGKSFTRIIQSIGRGLRVAPDKDHVDVYDISSDLKYGKKHLADRIKYYKEAQYEHNKSIIKYEEDKLDNELVDWE